jgi:peptidyl-prolyl cis-trans isomerase D
MAVISKIRSYSGLLIAVIGFALAAFVLGDFMGYGPGSRQRFDIAKIEKTTISYQEFERRVNEQLENWRAETGMTNVSPADAYQVRQQVWNSMLREILLDKEFEQLGLDVPREELYDQIHGTPPHSLIVRSFTNPQDGSFEPQSVVNFLRNFDQLDPSVRQQWANLEQFIKRDRLENKYHTLIRRGYHVPSLLARKDFADRNASIDFRFVYKSYADVADSLVSVSDRDLRRVYDENKERFRQEASRSLAYVSFPVFATEADRNALLAELEDLREVLTTTQDIAPFINSVSDARFDTRYYASGELSPEIDPLFFDAEIGAVHGPFIDGNAFVLAKLVDAQFRPDSMRASHILISYTGSMSANPEVMRSPDRARQLADSLLNVVRRSPARFAELASELSDDPSAQFNQGDLEWFNDGDMVAPFNEAVIEANVGSFTTAESDFGFHVIHVTGKSPATKKIQVARLTRDIEPSSRTYQSVYAEASGFAAMLRQKKNFHDVAEAKEVQVRVAENIREMDFSIPGIDNPRGIIQWAFLDDTRAGSHSRVFELDNNFVIATVTQVRDDGIPPLDQVRSEVMAIALREKKFEKIARQIQEVNGSLTAIAEAIDRDIVEANDIRFTTINLPVAGSEPKVVGAAFTLELGSLSEPIKGNNGVFVVEMTRKEEAIIPEDLTANKRTLQSSVANRVPNEVFQAIREEARIEDNRNLFY